MSPLCCLRGGLQWKHWYSFPSPLNWHYFLDWSFVCLMSCLLWNRNSTEFEEDLIYRQKKMFSFKIVGDICLVGSVQNITGKGNKNETCTSHFCLNYSFWEITTISVSYITIYNVQGPNKQTNKTITTTNKVNRIFRYISFSCLDFSRK